MPSSSNIRAGQAFVEMLVSDTDLRRGLRRAQMRLRAWAGSVKRIGRQIAVTSAMMLAPFAMAGKVYADFERQMAEVSTMVTDTGKHMGRFGEGVRQMSVRFGEATDTLSKGLYDILSASIDASQALDVLEVSAKAARAGVTDTGIAADAITTILNSYGLAASEAASVSDLLFTIVRRGKTTFAELAPQIGMVASTAANANVSMEELGAMIAGLSRVGVRTEHAITAVNRVIATFLAPSAEAAKMARSLGFEMSTATLASEGLLGVFRRIASLPPEAVAKLFPNIRALRGVIPALRHLEGLEEDLAAMVGRAGATEEAFEKMAGTMAFEMAQAKQTVMELARSVGEALAPTIREVAGELLNFLKPLTDWVRTNPELVAQIAKTIAVVGSLGVALWALGGVMTVIATHPILAALVGAVAVWTAYSGAVDEATASIKRMIDQSNRAYTEARGQLEELKALAGQQQLTNDQMDRAEGLLSKLEARYGDLGATVNRTTGAIEGFAEAQRRATEAILERRLRETRGALRAAEAAEASAREKRAEYGPKVGLERPGGLAARLRKFWGDQVLGLKSWQKETETAVEEARTAYQHAVKAMQDYQKEGEKTIATAVAVGTAMALGVGAVGRGGVPGLPPLPVKETIEAERWAAQWNAAVAEREEAQRQSAERVAEFEERLQEDVENARIRAIEDPHARRMAQIAAAERRELVAAREIGASVDAVQRKYEALRGIERGKGAVQRVESQVRGVFSAFALRGLGVGRGNEQLREQKKANEKLQKIVEVDQQLLQEFRQGWVVA